MNRSSRKALAEETVAIVRRGSYITPGGRAVDIAAAVRACLDRTRFLPPEQLARLRSEELDRSAPHADTVIEVANETTLAGVARLLDDDPGPVAALNFASARNPGGGFLGGSQAQEESLARSSALYASLLTAPGYYDRHRASRTPLYSDAIILSPACPVIRDDAGTLLAEPRPVTFVTSAAPNAGAAAANAPEEVAAIPAVLRRRAELVLAAAASAGCDRLVLGAWGCGVFRNDPDTVAEAFAAHLREGAWAGRFARVRFSVLDNTPGRDTIIPFKRAFGTPDDAQEGAVSSA